MLVEGSVREPVPGACLPNAIPTAGKFVHPIAAYSADGLFFSFHVPSETRHSLGNFPGRTCTVNLIEDSDGAAILTTPLVPLNLLKPGQELRAESNHAAR